MGTQALDNFKDRYRDYRWEPLAHRSAASIRSVYRLVKDGVPAFYIKIYDPVTPLQKLVNRLRPRTLHEARMLERLRCSGIRVPGVAAHLRCKGASALVTEAVHPVRPLWDLDRPAQASILLDMAVELLQNRFFYSDLHAGNVLLDKESRPVLIDAYEIKPLARVRPRHIIELISQVHSGYGLTEKDLAAALRKLGRPGQEARLIGRIKSRAAELHARRVGRWIRRSLAEGSFSRRERAGNYTALINRRFAVDIPALTDRITPADKPEQMLVGEQTITLHTFPRPGWFTTPQAIREWKGLLTLFFNMVPCDEPVAAIVYKDRRSVLATTSAHDGPDLEAWLRRNFTVMDFPQKRRCADALGRTIGGLHAKNIRHAELVCSRIKVGQDPLRFIFLPSASITQRRALTPGESLAALTQLDLSLPVAVGRTLKLTFIKAYAAAAGDETRRVARGCAFIAAGGR
ncbi:MAG: hypothetical protein ABFD81_15445 [Syntrophaceae bacterium]